MIEPLFCSNGAGGCGSSRGSIFEAERTEYSLDFAKKKVPVLRSWFVLEAGISCNRL